MRTFEKILIGGRWVTPRGQGHFDIVNPATEEVCGRIPRADVADADEAVRAARAALVGWKLTPAAERGRCLKAIADEMDERAAELGDVIVEELGSPGTRWSSANPKALSRRSRRGTTPSTRSPRRSDRPWPPAARWS